MILFHLSEVLFRSRHFFHDAFDFGIGAFYRWVICEFAYRSTLPGFLFQLTPVRIQLLLLFIALLLLDLFELSPYSCPDMPACTSGNVNTEPVCQIPGGHAGMPLCTHRGDLGQMPWGNHKEGSNLLGGGDLGGGALQGCKNMGAGWYLPNDSELTAIYNNKTAVGNIQNSAYWSAKEYSLTNATSINMTGGASSNINKGLLYYVRCVRRD